MANENYGIALGMIETRGLVPAIAGADACERVGDGLVAAHIIARPHREVEPVLPTGGSAE
ncbi:MAG: hypothetical protein P8Y83_12210 [Gammaproteobacteria bacterium]